MESENIEGKSKYLKLGYYINDITCDVRQEHTTVLMQIHQPAG